eukprot:CAMPEP_0170199340 /NCGR_PEP_ID=MMETSP0040_2-20121228/69284_1 /TAXON_ID=641309 /ORGANISM="Lotharella oceanica, Strain CCMP622" /LENGTH=389 /DNA_ID=CAMNT_0010449447 /DNA_START=368 /DNA_END=1537 /DNA_ORIENTATION=+
MTRAHAILLGKFKHKKTTTQICVKDDVITQEEAKSLVEMMDALVSDQLLDIRGFEYCLGIPSQACKKHVPDTVRKIIDSTVKDVRKYACKLMGLEDCSFMGIGLTAKMSLLSRQTQTQPPTQPQTQHIEPKEAAAAAAPYPDGVEGGYSTSSSSSSSCSEYRYWHARVDKAQVGGYSTSSSSSSSCSEYRYWHARVDKAQVPDYDVSAILFLDHVHYRHHHHDGWEEMFDEDFNLRVGPKPGRLLLFGSGFENLHRARPILKGHRTCLEMWFTFSHKEPYDQLEDFQLLEHGPPKPRHFFQVDLDRIDDNSYRKTLGNAMNEWEQKQLDRQPIEEMHKKNWLKRHRESLRELVSKFGPPKTTEDIENLIKRVEKRNGSSYELEEALAGA